MINSARPTTIFILSLLLGPFPAQAGTIVYTTEASFKASLDASITDTYGSDLGYSAGVISLLGDKEMSSIFGETRYFGAGYDFPRQHSILGHPFAPMNNKYSPVASVLLNFQGTSFGDVRGVLAVGFEVSANVPRENDGPNYAFVTYYGGDTNAFLLPLHNPNPHAPLFQINTNYKYWGISSSLPIESIHLGRQDGKPMSVNGSYAIIDNLTLGMVSPVPEPSAWIMMLVGFGFIGSVARKTGRLNKLSGSLLLR